MKFGKKSWNLLGFILILSNHILLETIFNQSIFHKFCIQKFETKREWALLRMGFDNPDAEAHNYANELHFVKKPERSRHFSNSTEPLQTENIRPSDKLINSCLHLSRTIHLHSYLNITQSLIS